jgi:ORF6N domain
MDLKPVLPEVNKEQIKGKIRVVRRQRVMLDMDLAILYDVETKQLKRAIKRNIARFPPDFMFEVTLAEWQDLRYHFGTSSWGGARFLPFAFSEQGVAMLSSVLRSGHAIQMNIAIMRAFIATRQMAVAHGELLRQLAELTDRERIGFRVYPDTKE